jgi:hypothetical protein
VKPYGCDLNEIPSAFVTMLHCHCTHSAMASPITQKGAELAKERRKLFRTARGGRAASCRASRGPRHGGGLAAPLCGRFDRGRRCDWRRAARRRRSFARAGCQDQPATLARHARPATIFRRPDCARIVAAYPLPRAAAATRRWHATRRDVSADISVKHGHVHRLDTQTGLVRSPRWAATS